jgi:hypothetical protein
MTTENLLQRAGELLDASCASAGPRRMRIAAFLIRQALEGEVSAHCARLVGCIDHPVRMRSRLLVLHALDESGVVGRIEYAWTALSRACHHHAYELAPTASELRYLHSLVTGLAEARALATMGETS